MLNWIQALAVSNFFYLVSHFSELLLHVFQFFFLICYLVVEYADELILFCQLLLNLIYDFHVLVHLLRAHVLLLGKLLTVTDDFLHFVLYLQIGIALLLELLDL